MNVFCCTPAFAANCYNLSALTLYCCEHFLISEAVGGSSTPGKRREPRIRYWCSVNTIPCCILSCSISSVTSYILSPSTEGTISEILGFAATSAESQQLHDTTWRYVMFPPKQANSRGLVSQASCRVRKCSSNPGAGSTSSSSNPGPLPTRSRAQQHCLPVSVLRRVQHYCCCLPSGGGTGEPPPPSSPDIDDEKSPQGVRVLDRRALRHTHLS